MVPCIVMSRRERPAIRIPKASHDLLETVQIRHRFHRASVAALLFGIGLTLSGLTLSSTARAEPLPATLSVGSSARVVASRGEGSTHLAFDAGRRGSDQWDLPFALEDVRVEELWGGPSALYVVRGRGEHVEIAALVAPAPRMQILWRGRLDWHGDPGERVADVLEVRTSGGSARPEVVVGQRREGLAECGEPPALLDPRAVRVTRHDGGSRLELAPLAPTRDVVGLTPLDAQPLEGREAPRLHALRLTLASGEAARDGDMSADPPNAALLGPPAGLTDGNRSTGWSAPSEPTSALLRARYAGPPLTGIALHAGAPRSLPRRLVLRVDGAGYLVSIPETLASGAWIPLPSPTPSACVSIAIVEGASRPASPDARPLTGFSEIDAYCVVDEPGGIAPLIERLVADDADGDRVVGWLAASGPPTITALEEAWPRLGPRGKRRALRVLAGIEQIARPASVRAAIRALRARGAADDDEEVRRDAAQALGRGDDEDRAALFDVAVEEPHETPIAASALAEGAGLPEGAWERVTELDRSAFDRPALRAIVARGLIRHARWREALSSGPLDGHAMAAIAASVADERDGSVELVRQLASAALETPAARAEFDTRYRLARALRVVPDAALGWLDEQARSADAWMLRAAALDALGARASADLLAHALRDPVPRVRLAAARVVAHRRGGEATLFTLARHDPWPLVRSYALGELVDRPEGRALVIAALGDPLSAMRASALGLLRSRPAADVDEPLGAILLDAREWPHVTSRAVELAEARCAPSLGPALVRVVERGARQDASASQLENAQLALRVALRMGGETAARARRAARGPSAPAFDPLLSHPQPPCEPTSEVNRGVPRAE